MVVNDICIPNLSVELQLITEVILYAKSINPLTVLVSILGAVNKVVSPPD